MMRFNNILNYFQLPNLHVFASLSVLLMGYQVGLGPHLLTGIFSSMATMMCLKQHMSTERLATRELYLDPNFRMRVVENKLVTEQFCSRDGITDWGTVTDVCTKATDTSTL